MNLPMRGADGWSIRAMRQAGPEADAYLVASRGEAPRRG